MLLYSLSFVIILIFVYESYKNYKLYQKKLAAGRDNFTDFDYPNPARNITGVKDVLNNEEYPPLQECALDTTRTKAFAPLIYDSSRKLYFSRRHLDQEGERQNAITDKQIAKVRELSKAEKDPDIKRLYEYELGLHKWKEYPFQATDNFGNQRLREDITTDYLPGVFGQQRIWEEIHFHTDRPKIEIKSSKI